MTLFITFELHVIMAMDRCVFHEKYLDSALHNANRFKHSNIRTV